MFGGGNSFGSSIHDDVLNAFPEDNDAKRRLIDEIKSRAKGSISTRNFPEAVKLYSKAIELGLEKSILFANRSMCYFSQGAYTEALSDADSSIEADADYAKGYYRKGVAHIALKQFDHAVAALETGLALVPNDKDFRTQLEKAQKLKASVGNAPISSSPSSIKKSSTPSSSITSSPSPVSQTPNANSTSTTTDNMDVDDDDEEGNLGNLRGYKKTTDGKVTTYFNNELDENARALIGDIAPKKITIPEAVTTAITPSVASGSSVWNAAGTWEEKVFTPWAQQRLRELLSSISITCNNNNTTATTTTTAKDKYLYKIIISEVKAVEGDAQITLMRGKRKHIYDFKADLLWTLTCHNTNENNDNENTDNTEISKATGKLTVLDISADREYEFVLEVSNTTGSEDLSTQIKSFIKSDKYGLKPAIVTTLTVFDDEFKSK
eukprot:gene1186-2310_t